MTTLSIERSQYGAYWLVLHRSPGDEGKKLAVFKSAQDAEMYKAALAQQYGVRAGNREERDMSGASEAFRELSELTRRNLSVDATKTESRDASDMLLEAAGIVAGARNTTHGNKERSFDAIAQNWTTYLATRRVPHGPIRPHDVAHMMVLLKQQRAEHGQPVRDHSLDAAAYSAIAGELSHE